MRRARVTLVGLALALASSHPAGAASGFHAKDATGDANGLNGQALGLQVPTTSTSPASVAAADIVGLDVTTKTKTVKGKKVPYATVVTLTLAAPLQQGVTYMVTAVAPSGCDGDGPTNKRIQMSYQDHEALVNSFAMCHQGDTTGGSVDIGYAEADPARGRITWLLEKASMGQKPGETLTTFEATTSVYVVGVFDAFSPKGTFTFAR